MKICPTCQRKYTEGDLNFCLDDGALLQPFQGQNDSPDTLRMNSPVTNPFTPPGSSAGGQSSPTKGAMFPQQPRQYSVQPVKKTSKAWLWAVGILASVMVLCGGGLGILMFIGKMSENANANYNARTNPPVPGNAAPVNKIVIPSQIAPRKIALSDNLSKWQSSSPSGITEYRNNTLLMASKAKGFYYVRLGGDKYTTENANTKVTVANPYIASSDLGYGLVLHSSPTPFEKDYAFLIDSIGGRYRIVYHTPNNEDDAVDWKDSTAVNKGAAANILEMRDANGSMEFYINDQKVETLKNIYGYKGGVAGLYSGDGVKAAFSNLEIYR